MFSRHENMIGLFVAIERGDAQKVEQLLEQLPRQNVSKMLDYRRRTAVHLAVERGCEEVLDVVLQVYKEDKEDQLGAEDGGGFTALHLAAELGHHKIAARLLEMNPELAVRRAQDNLSCLHLAAIRGHPEIVKLLLEVSPDLIVAEDKDGRPALHFAVEYGHDNIVAMLVEFAKLQESFSAAMFHAAIRSCHDKIVTELLDHRPSLIDAKDIRDSRSALHLAASFGRHAIVAQLFARRPDRFAGVGGSHGGNLLHFTAKYGYDAMVAELLVNKPQLIHEVDPKRQRTPLHFAAKNGHYAIVEQLLAGKPELIDVKDVLGWTPLHFAAQGGHGKIVDQLLSHKPELLDAADRNDKTALAWACDTAQPHAAARLLAHDPAVIDGDMMWGAVDSSRRDDSKITEVVKLLAARKPELMESVENEEDKTLLHRVFGLVRHEEGEEKNDMRLRSEELMRTVWELSPSGGLCAIDTNGNTPFEVAIECKNEFAIELMHGKLSLEEIANAFHASGRFCPQSFFEKYHGFLLEVASSNDVVGLICTYVDLDPPTCARKRHREKKTKGSTAKKTRMKYSEEESEEN